jgi:phosphocarrier protein
LSSDGVSRQFVIANQLGLHARAAATLVRVASQFQAEVTIRKGDQAVNGKSILGMMTLAAAKGTPIVVTCQGQDQDKALDAIGACIQNKFGED